MPESESLKRAVNEGWILVRTPELTEEILGPAANQLGRGELEAILLAKQLQALLLTDDSEGRALAQRLGIQVSGTVGVLIRAKTQGHLLQLKPMLDRLRHETNFRMSEDLYKRALQAAKEVGS